MRTTAGAIFALLLIMMSGCSTAPPPRTPGMEALGVDATTAELRQKIYQYESVFASTVNSAAGDIFARETDQKIRELSIRWKINSVPAIQSAVFQLDPLAGMADAWGLTAQMHDFFATGNGKDLFGDSQHIAIEASLELRDEIRELANSVVGEERFQRVRPKLISWLEQNPIPDITFARRSTAIDAAAITAAEWGTGAMQSVGQIEDVARDLSDRLAIYGTQVPELARAHSELFAIELDEYMLDPVWASIEGLDRSHASVDLRIQNIDDFIESTPELIAAERQAILEALERELGVALTDVDRQRVETLLALTAEREAVVSDMDSLRATTLADFERARVTATTDIEAIVERRARAFTADAEGLIDILFWRALILMAIGLVGLAVVLRVTRPPTTA